MSEHVAECGCWVDERGYWRLSEPCRQVERDQWTAVMHLSRRFAGHYAKQASEGGA